MTKQCSKCKIKKDTSLFFKHIGRKDGYQDQCKKCCLKGQKLYREKNPEIYKAQMRKLRSSEYTLKSKLRSRKEHREMSDGYIRSLITMHSSLNTKDIPDEMVEMHRLNLAIKRQLKLTPKLKGEEDKP